MDSFRFSIQRRLYLRNILLDTDALAVLFMHFRYLLKFLDLLRPACSHYFTSGVALISSAVSSRICGVSLSPGYALAIAAGSHRCR